MKKEDLLAQKMGTHYAVKGDQNFIKDVDTGTRTVTGFYNTYNYVDSDGDVLLMNCAKKSIEERGPDSSATAKIKHALFHDLSRLPGKINVLKETTINGVSGIYFETKMAKTTEGNDTLQNYLEEVYDNHSIGFRYLNIDVVEKESDEWSRVVSLLINQSDAEKLDYLFIVKEIALFEGSTVAFGANKLTPFLGAKSQSKESYQLAINNRIDKISKTLKNGKQSDEAMDVFNLQLLQLKQIFCELAEQITSEKSTLIKPDNNLIVEDQKIKTGINYDYLLTKF
jgi:hypothetical protein